MTPAEIEKLVVDRIYEGKSHQEVYDEMNTKFPNREIDLARIVSKIVSLPQRNRYGVHNIVLVVLLSLAIAWRVFFAFRILEESGIEIFILAMLFPAAYVVMIWGVLKWKLITYNAVGVLGLMGLFKANGLSVVFAINPFALLPMGMIILGFFLHAQLGGKYKTASQQYTDAKGQIRARHIIRFTN